MSRFAIILLAAMLAPSATPQTRGQDLFTAREMEWAAAALPLLERQPAIAGAAVEAARYLTDLGRRLAPGVPSSRVLPYRLILYDDRLGALEVPYFGRLRWQTEVTTLPGGIVLVPASLFRTSANERDFATAVARGIAHVALGSVARAARMLRPLGEQPFVKSWYFTRRMETEADLAAAVIVERLGPGRSGERKFEMLKRRLGGGPTLV